MAGLSGCGGGVNDIEQQPVTPQAATLLQQKLYSAAAAEYLSQVKGADPASASRALASAANALLSAGDRTSAQTHLARIPPAGLAPHTAALAALAKARLAYLAGKAGQAEQLLPRPEQLTPEWHPSLLKAKVDILDATGAGLKLAEARTRLDLELSDPAARQANYEGIWDALQWAERAQLSSVNRPPLDSFGGWVELALIGKTYLTDVDALRQELATWQARFPNHPGQFAVVDKLLAESERLSLPANRITLMLPLTGQFADAGAALRDGFITAWLAEGQHGSERSISIIDTNDQDPGTAYLDAVEAGAQFIIGPLRKEAVTAISNTGDIRVPTLVLNTVARAADSGAPPAGLFQLALSPEQEAGQVAERIWFDGYVAAAVIGPSGNWGERVTSAFAQAFERLGGTVVETGQFDPEERDLSAPVKALLSIEQSEQRFKAVRKLVGTNVAFAVRRRQDIDAIFMAGFANQARMLRPQLRFHRASRVPVYATSHVYTGVPNADLDRDIDGVIFGDMPWILTPVDEQGALRQVLEQHWPEAMAGYSRLFALGADAAALVKRAGRLRAQPGESFQGHTGTLLIGDNNVVIRQLKWARITEGVPELLGTAVSLSPSNRL